MAKKTKVKAHKRKTKKGKIIKVRNHSRYINTSQKKTYWIKDRDGKFIGRDRDTIFPKGTSSAGLDRTMIQYEPVTGRIDSGRTEGSTIKRVKPKKFEKSKKK